MVLDEEMEQAALKIQSTFRGHKTRNEIKTKQDCKTEDENQQPEKEEQKDDSIQNVDDDIANMVLDDEMAQAALKIQSTFRGHKTRKEQKDKKNAEDNDKNDEEEEENKDEEKKSEEKDEAKESSSSDKSAKQLQDEEDIANLVMDDEMEKTALKIQSAFRGKFKRKTTKDADESCIDSSAEDKSDYDGEENEESLQKSDENPNDMYEYFGVSNDYASEERGNSYDEVDYNDYLVNRQSYMEESRYSSDRYDIDVNETIYPEESEDDMNLMHGGGIFVEPSGSFPSGTMELSTEDSDEDKKDNNNQKKFDDKNQSSNPSNDDEENPNEKIPEEKVIESFDFETNKNSAEALYYSLKKNEIEAQKLFEDKNANLETDSHEEFQDISNLLSEGAEMLETDENEEEEDEDDDDDVVVKTPPTATASAKMLKYGMSMDDRLLGSILSHDYAQNSKKAYPDDGFDPLLEETMRLNNFLETSNSEEDKLFGTYQDDSNMGDEDQFDDFYPGNIRSKMMASSISIADSDYFDPTNNKSIIDDDTIRTALETIHSTDSESTIASAATKIQVNDKNLTTRRNNNFQYSSIGNAAIDKSLDDFIQSQELRVDKFEEEPEGYNSPPPKKQESCDDYTDDTCTESDKKPTGVIEIKLEQKHFLTIDQRRRTLHREDAIQRNSTRSNDEDSSKSSNASYEKNTDRNNSQSEALITIVQKQNSIIDTEIAVPTLPSNFHLISFNFLF